MIETMLVSYDADVCESTEEYERAEFELLIGSGSFEAGKQRARTAAFEVDAGRIEDTPHKSRAVETIWSFRTPAITRAKPLIDSSKQCGLVVKKIGSR